MELSLVTLLLPFPSTMLIPVMRPPLLNYRLLEELLNLFSDFRWVESSNHTG